MQKVNIGISENERKEIADGLARVLADTYSLYLKTHNYHWNVTGPLFQELHSMFETQYQDLAEAVDEIAERIRALGSFAPGTYLEFQRLSSIPDTLGVPAANQMVQQLVEGNETVIRTARNLVLLAENAVDEATLDLLTERVRKHEKTAWMLRSLLEAQPSMSLS